MLVQIHLLERSVWIPRPVSEVFDFFASPANLAVITPPWVAFEILTPDVEMQVGALIDYKLKVRGFPMRWRTRIDEFEVCKRFVDRQLRGPYKLWIHEHEFESVDGGTQMTDRVQYAIAGGLLEPWIDRWLVAPDVDRIFEYRNEQILNLFKPEKLTHNSVVSALRN